MKFSQVKLNCVQDSLPVYYHLFSFRRVSQTVLEKLRNLFPSLGCGIALSTWSIWYHITFSLFGRMNLFSTDMNTDIKFCIMKADVLSFSEVSFFIIKDNNPVINSAIIYTNSCNISWYQIHFLRLLYCFRCRVAIAITISLYILSLIF